MKNQILPKSLECAVLKTASKVEESVCKKPWDTYHENELFYEIITGILGSQVQYETADYYSQKLFREGLTRIKRRNGNPDIFEDKVCNILSSPPYRQYNSGRRVYRYRFPRLKASQIRRTAESVYGKGDTFTDLLSQCQDALAARNVVMNRTIGIGPKQASLFLRNIGFSDDLAILDVHVLRFMSVLNLTSELVKNVSRICHYERIERTLKGYAEQVNHKLASLDMAIWIVMRVYMKEFA